MCSELPWGSAMSVTGSVRVDEDRGVSPPPRPRSRSWTSRVSFGHGLMVAAGLLAALLNFVALRGGDDATWVVTAGRDIQPGEILTSELLSTVQLADGAPLLGGLVTADRIGELDGATSAARIAAGEPVLRSAVAPRGSSDGLRAMSVPIDPSHAVGGGLRVGDRVDVIEVHDGGARYVATDVAVIGVAEAASGGALGGLGAYSITLAVDDATALRLAVGLRGDRLEIVRSTGAPAPAELDHRVGGERDARSADAETGPASPEGA